MEGKVYTQGLASEDTLQEILVEVSCFDIDRNRSGVLTGNESSSQNISVPLLKDTYARSPVPASPSADV